MIIILLSGKAESGKDTFHKEAEKYINKQYSFFESTRIAFADAVKDCAKDMGWNGEKDEKGRSGLIMIGDGARNYFDKDIWIKKAIRKLIDIDSINPAIDRGNDSIVFVTDCRYPNEVTMLKDWAESSGNIAYSIRVERPNHISRLTQEQLKNDSEMALDNFVEWDYIVENHDLDEFIESIKIVIDEVTGVC